jgi:hypothetical protein
VVEVKTIRALLGHNDFSGCAVSRINRRGWIFSDLRTEDSASVVSDRRADDFRAINSITLCEQIVSDLASGREFFAFFALFDRPTLPPQIRCFFRAPVAQLDRASDYGFKTNELHVVSLLCIPPQTLGNSAVPIRTMLLRIALFFIKNPADCRKRP